MGHSFAGVIGVEATINREPLNDQIGEPRRVGSGSGGGDATVVGMKGKATDRIKFSDLNLGILHKLDAGQNRVPEGGRAEAVHGKSRVYTP